MNETGDALRSCMEQLLLFRDEKERLVIEAANDLSSEQKKTQDLKQKFEDANKQFEKVIAENYNLRNTVDSKEKLIKELKESKAHSEQKLTDATAKLEFSQKQCASLKYEVRMLQEELEIRNKERGYDLKSIHAAQKQQEESIKKIAALEAECQRLRTMVQKRLPGPAALAKMKDEVKRQGTSSAENGTRRPRAVVQPQLGARHSVSEGYQVKLKEFGDENRHLRQLLAQKESDMQFVRWKYVDEACKLSMLQKQHEELSDSHGLTENNHPERMVIALAKLDHSRSGKQQVFQMRSRGRRITGSDIQLLVDPVEIEKLERASRPSSAPHECMDTPNADSKMVVSETVHRDIVPDDGFSDKYPELIQDVLKVIIHKHQVSKISVASIIDEVTHALRSEISAKGNDDASLSYDREELNKMVATLRERVSSMVERSTKSNVMRFQSFFHEKSELTLRLAHLVHVCSDVLDGKANLEKLADEVCLILEWIVSQCFWCLDGLDVTDYITNNSDGNESLWTLSIHEKDAMQSTNLEMDFGMQQDKQKELIETTEGQIPDVTLRNHSQIEFISKLDAELLAVNEGQGGRCQEQHLVYRETESAASDESKEKIAEEGKKLKTTSAISAAAKKLAECQETIANLSKQLHALENPANADASYKEKCGTLPPPVANLVAEADPKPEGLSPPTSEEATRIKEHSEPDATEKSHEHGESGTGAKARKNGSAPIVIRPMVPKSPRASVSADARKKKRRASLLSLLSSHGCKGS
ncbi:filament-like plant protein 4 isoform X2 [Setaria italica]|nr:filament-like plant protein 4 isoform X2 [Setaria italica]